MDAAEQWEPDEARASRPVLRARGGEIPPRDSPYRRLPARGGRPALPGRDARAVEGVCVVAASREDPVDRVRTLRGRTPPAARARQAGDFRLPGLYLHLWQDPLRQIPASAEEPAGPHEGEAADDQGGAAAAHAPVDPRAGALAEAGRGRLLQLPCRADQRACPGRVPAPCYRPLAAHATASQSEGSDDVGADDATGGRVAPETKHPTSLAERSLCRHTPEVGSACGKVARAVLCGGRVMKHASLPLLALSIEEDGPERSAPMKVEGGCDCGNIRYEAEVDPAKVVICHCTDCQTLSGSAFRTVVPTNEGALKLLSGAPKVYVKAAENGNRRKQTFCPECGTP